MVARGIYSYLPLAWRSLKKIENIVREEMDRSGAQEVFLPAVQPAGLWKESGRWDNYGPELLRFQDRKDGDFCLGPTHEEVITDLIRDEISSYKQLPVNLYQVQTKFRDEPRPRFGIMRGREFIMKDAYSFDVDKEGANESYDAMFEAYERIFDRMGFEYSSVEAATGNIGGSRSHEFQVLADTGGDKLVRCAECGYAANVEKARAEYVETRGNVEPRALEEVETPGKKTIEEVSEYLEIDPASALKTLIYIADDQPVAVLVRGDQSANEVKIGEAISQYLDLNPAQMRLASDEEIEEITSAPVGFAGPVDIDIPVLADKSIDGKSDFVTGANRADLHYKGVEPGRDFEVVKYTDLELVEEGDVCGECGGEFEAQRGIEVGHVFYLGTKYSEAMDATVQDEDGQNCPLIMGCYGIGVTRILAAAVEQNHDENGIIWPRPIAPFSVNILPLQMQNDDVVEAAESLYESLQERGIEVLIDDRDEGVGAKFNDADLIGIPLRVTIGSRGIENGEVEIEWRGEDETHNIAVDDAVDTITEMLSN
jgi:prolyl-tRNA synthetase